jgi:hypothetical protein
MAMNEKKQTSAEREALARRKGELRGEIAALAARIAHLTTQAKAVEAGNVETRDKFDRNKALMGGEEHLKFQPSAAVGYWREIRQHEERLDLKRAELRALEDDGIGGLRRFEVHYYGPPDSACPTQAPSPHPLPRGEGGERRSVSR